MTNGDFFSNMMGFSVKYTETSKAQFDDETDYEDVDFCQGEEIEEKENQFSLFGESDAVYGGSSNDIDSLFAFNPDEDENIG